MGLTGCFRSVRAARTAALVIGGALAATAMPAEARLSPLPIGGPMAGGLFQGVPVRAAARPRLSKSEPTGVAGASCHVLRQIVRDRFGANVLRTVQVCE
jgi:hypothetical protein